MSLLCGHAVMSVCVGCVEEPDSATDFDIPEVDPALDGVSDGRSERNVLS